MMTHGPEDTEAMRKPVDADELATTIATYASEAVYKELRDKYLKKYSDPSTPAFAMMEGDDLTVTHHLTVTIKMELTMKGGHLVRREPSESSP